MFILDNADDLALVQEFLPSAFRGHLLVTTRAQMMGKVVGGKLEVEEMRPEIGALLLLRRAGMVSRETVLEEAPDEEMRQAKVLAEALGGLPLALDQAGAYIDETQCSLEDYSHQYQVRRAELLARRGGINEDHPEAVATTWSLSFVKVEQANPSAAELLQACAFLASDAIPEELLVEMGKTPLPSVTKQQEQRGEFSPSTSEKKEPLRSKHEQVQPWEIDEAVATLRAYSLMQRNTGEKTFRVHRLVQAVVRDALEEQEQVAWITCTIQAVNALFPDVSFDTWEQCARYLLQAQACATWIFQRDLPLREGASLLDRAGWYLDERGQYTQAEPLLVRALAIREQQLGPEHPHTALSLDNLANLCQYQRKYTQAEPLLVRALAIREQQLGAKHPDTANSLNNLASIYWSQGKYAQAEPLFVRALAIREQQLGPEHPHTATSLDTLALLYQSQGKYTEAEPLFVRALAIREQQLGPEHPYTATSLNNLASLYENQGKYTEAEPLHVRALAIYEQQLGAEHPYTATSLIHLAALYQSQGKYAQAEPLLVRALTIYEQQLGPEHPYTADSLSHLAALYQRQGKDTEAEPLHVRALAIKEQQLGPEHPDTATSLIHLASLYRRQGKYTEAEPLLVRALAIYEQQLGPEHPYTATSLNNLASLYRSQRKYTEAERLFRRAFTIREQALGPEHPDTARSLWWLAVFAEQRRHDQEAKRLYERALAIFQRTLGPEHLTTQGVQRDYTALLHSMKKNGTTSL